MIRPRETEKGNLNVNQMHKIHEERRRKSKGTPLAMKAAIFNFYLLFYVSGRMFYYNNQKHRSVDWISRNNYRNNILGNR